MLMPAALMYLLELKRFHEAEPGAAREKDHEDHHGGRRHSHRRGGSWKHFCEMTDWSILHNSSVQAAQAIRENHIMLKFHFW